MAVKKKGKNKKPTADPGDTPITVGGGGDGRVPADVTITYNQGLWTQTPGLLTLTRGKIKSIQLTFDGVNIQLPVKGTMALVLDCNKP
ncbi:MAG TPA: hypothetical protein VJT71_11770 [Pyrinomonadaceae bacterium]|nr:hypothetical protein [Pyrinomonadaceae bacterium]